MTELLPLNNAHLPVKLRLEDYLRLDDAGAFADYRKTELIDGEIYFMNAQHREIAIGAPINAATIAGLIVETGGL